MCFGFVSPVFSSVEEEAVTVQDFERPFEVGKWPEDALVEFSRAWSYDGRTSLKLGDESMAAISELAATNWSGYDILRLHVNVPGHKGCALGVEIQDDHTSFHNRHQNNASAPPGESTIDIDIAGDLWRGEVGRPYRDVKTPINKGNISRLGLFAHGAPLYVDGIQLIKLARLATPGGWAFDFGGPSTPVQSQWTGVFPETKWDGNKGYGFAGEPRFFPKTTPYPTPVLGDGLMFDGAEFGVSLTGGPYAAWVIFERSGFWEGEQAAYAKLSIAVNGKCAYSRKDSPAAAYFDLQDLEVLNQKDLVEMVMRRQGEGEFKFKAAPGRNRFRLIVKGLKGEPPRLAGMVLAPDTAEGRAFIEAHRAGQSETIAGVNRIIAGIGRARSIADSPTLSVRPLPTGHVMTPEDGPPDTGDNEIPALECFAGMTAFRTLGLYANEELLVAPKLSRFTGPGGRIDPAAIDIWSNVYLPVRDYETTAAKIRSHHYRPADELEIGPGTPRCLLICARLPQNQAPGEYRATLTLCYGEYSKKEIPLTISVMPGSLPPFDFPLGLFFSGVPVPAELLNGSGEYWRLSGQLLDWLAASGRTMLTGGPNYRVRWKNGKARYEGKDCVRLLAMARRRGLDAAVSGYGGFSLGLGPRGFPPQPGMSDEQIVREMHRAWQAFQILNGLPQHYVYSYDEPGTPEDFAPIEKRLKLYREAGFKTIGYTSMADPESADENHRMLARETYAPAFNGHSPKTLAYVRRLGNEPWIYNNGLERYYQGVHLWRNRKAGAAGRVEWIAAIIQGFQYDTLDGREPDPSCFFIHSKLGVLFAPRFLDLCEGAFDAKLLFELERKAKLNADTAAAAGAFGLLSELESLPYREALVEHELDEIRSRALALLREF